MTRETPFLYVDDAGKYRVFLPALRHNTSGTTWDSGQPGLVGVDQHDFYIAKPGDSALKINLELALGKNLILTPGRLPPRRAAGRDPQEHGRCSASACRA